MDDLRGKVAVVTGGASGIGRALADRFAAEGMSLVVADIEEAALDAAAKELADGGADVLAVPTDVSSPESVDELARATFDRFGTAHVVCNNAGVGGHGYGAWEGPLEEWEWVLGVNLWGVVHGVRAFVPALVEQDEGHVVNTASMAGLAALPFMGPYSTSKHAVVGLSEVLFHELAVRSSAVKVSVLCPGFLNTRIIDSDRNWLDRLGSAPPRAQDEGAELMEQLGRALMEAAPSPSGLAGSVVDAIRTGRFLVLTDTEMAAAAMASRHGAVEGADPVLPIG
ncbi:MAG: SDR family NAD(P)-dependent oxidoreductase [Acidimicrobiia bacterium]